MTKPLTVSDENADFLRPEPALFATKSLTRHDGAIDNSGHLARQFATGGPAGCGTKSAQSWHPGPSTRCQRTTVLENDGVATLGPVVYQRGAEHVDQIYDVTIAGTLAFIRELSGPRWRPERVLF